MHVETRPVVVDRRETALGEWILRRRISPAGQEVFEMVANGVFLMDSEEHGTEAALGRIAREGLGAPGPTGWSILVGGLGFGYTLRALLEDDRVGRVVVVEWAQAVVDWVGGPVRHLAGDPLADRRVQVVHGDVAALLGDQDTAWDAIVLDVDNGPTFLVHEHNAALYSVRGLRRARAVLRPGGRLALWSSERSAECAHALRRVFGTAEEHPFAIQRGRHRFDYFVYAATR